MRLLLLLLHVSRLRLSFRLGVDLGLRLLHRWDNRFRLHLRRRLDHLRRRLFFIARRLFLFSGAHDDLLPVLLTETVVVGVKAVHEGGFQA